MTYKQLSAATVVDYLKNIAAIAPLITADSKAIEIGDGNINFVYIVDGLKNGKKLAIKQAVPYLRCVGEDYALAKERMIFEAKSLQLFSKISPQHIPKLYHIDFEMMLVVMQCLDSHIIMRKGLIAETIYPHFVEHITDHLSQVLFKTSSLYLSSKEKRELMKDYIANDELCKITEDFVFTTPYITHATNPENSALHETISAFQTDNRLKMEALKLKNKFMNQTDALLHGDLHTGSIMINQTETKIIDSEFAFFGPIGFDIGALIANLILSWISHFARSQNAAYQHWLVETILAIYQQFEIKFLNLWNAHAQTPSALMPAYFCTEALLKNYQHYYMQQILQDSIGYAGIKIARRIIGIAGVADIRDIEDPFARAKVEKMALAIAKNLILERTTINHISAILPILAEVHHYNEQY